jgi:hypothetical protein
MNANPMHVALENLHLVKPFGFFPENILPNPRFASIRIHSRFLSPKLHRYPNQGGNRDCRGGCERLA